VVVQEMFTERMMVTGSDIGAAGFEQQAGQGQSAAQLDDPPIGNVDVLDGLGQCPAGRPELTEQAPACRTDACAPGFPVRVSVLHMVTECTEPVFPCADAHVELPGFITGHIRPSCLNMVCRSNDIERVSPLGW